MDLKVIIKDVPQSLIDGAFAASIKLEPKASRRSSNDSLEFSYLDALKFGNDATSRMAETFAFITSMHIVQNKIKDMLKSGEEVYEDVKPDQPGEEEIDNERWKEDGFKEFNLSVKNVPKKLIDKAWRDIITAGMELNGRVAAIPDTIEIDFLEIEKHMPAEMNDLFDIMAQAQAFYMTFKTEIEPNANKE